MSRKGRLLTAGAGALFVVMLAFPLYYAVAGSVARIGGVAGAPPLFPLHPRFDAYRTLFSERNFWLPIRNSLVVAGATTFLCVALGSLCAYALARLRFVGRGLILAFVLSVTMFPQISIVSPLYLLLRDLDLIDTYPGLVLPYLAFAMPLTVWLLFGYFRQLPPALEDAARVDGAGRLRAFASVILPLSLPGLATSALLTFLYCWNEFLFALSFTTTPSRRTIPVAVAFLSGRYELPWSVVLAAGIVGTVPVAILALLFQRRIVKGLTRGAVKE